MQWFRMYYEAIDDEKLRLLAFEDRWHFVALLCCKGQGLLDAGDEPALMHRKLAVKLGVQTRELDEIARRLAEVGLIDRQTLQPVAWATRQYASDNSARRVAKHRKRQKQQQKQQGNGVKQGCNVTVTPSETDTDTDTDTEKREKPQKRKRFVRPTLQEVEQYIREIRGSTDAQQWMDFYESKGWKVGKNPMKDWKACVRTWERRHEADQRDRYDTDYERGMRKLEQQLAESGEGVAKAGADVRGTVLSGVWTRT